MVIGIDASRANKKKKTGTEWYSFFLIQELKKLDTGHKFKLYTNVGLEEPLNQLPKNFQEARLSWPLKRLWTQIRLSVELMLRPPDALFVPAHVAPFLSRCRTVVTVHDVGFKRMPELYSAVERWYHELTLWAAVHFANIIICPSNFTKRELSYYYPTAENKIRVVPHGVYKIAKEAQLGIRENPKPFFLYVGRLEKKKNILNLLKAVKLASTEIKDLKLVLVGAPGNGYEEFLDCIKKEGLGNNVTLLGYVPEDKKKQLYEDATAFVFPSRYEGFGMPILEAQAHGCPVITSRGIATEEVAQGSAILIDQNKPEEISEAMIQIQKDKALREELSAKGRYNIQRFSWVKAAEDTLKALTDKE